MSVPDLYGRTINTKIETKKKDKEEKEKELIIKYMEGKKTAATPPQILPSIQQQGKIHCIKEMETEDYQYHI